MYGSKYQYNDYMVKAALWRENLEGFALLDAFVEWE